LEKAGYEVEVQKRLEVRDEDGYLLGDYFADLVVNGELILELKAASALAGEHYAQVLNYLKITGFKKALLINFGSYRFETRTVVPNFSPSPPLHGQSTQDYLPISTSTRPNVKH
jgi:GxxExxY protein